MTTPFPSHVLMPPLNAPQTIPSLPAPMVMQPPPFPTVSEVFDAPPFSPLQEPLGILLCMFMMTTPSSFIYTHSHMKSLPFPKQRLETRPSHWFRIYPGSMEDGFHLCHCLPHYLPKLAQAIAHTTQLLQFVMVTSMNWHCHNQTGPQLSMMFEIGSLPYLWPICNQTLPMTSVPTPSLISNYISFQTRLSLTLPIAPPMHKPSTTHMPRDAGKQWKLSWPMWNLTLVLGNWFPKSLGCTFFPAHGHSMKNKSWMA